MKWSLLTLIALSVTISALAQVVLKTGMSSASVAKMINLGTPIELAVAIVMNPWVMAGLGMYFFGALVWLFVLARVDVSFAYPFVGLGFIVTMIVGKFVLGDDITFSRFAGTLLVAAGVVLIARS